MFGTCVTGIKKKGFLEKLYNLHVCKASVHHCLPTSTDILYITHLSLINTFYIGLPIAMLHRYVAQKQAM